MKIYVNCKKNYDGVTHVRNLLGYEKLKEDDEIHFFDIESMMLHLPFFENNFIVLHFNIDMDYDQVYTIFVHLKKYRLEMEENCYQKFEFCKNNKSKLKKIIDYKKSYLIKEKYRQFYPPAKKYINSKKEIIYILNREFIFPIYYLDKYSIKYIGNRAFVFSTEEIEWIDVKKLD